MGRARQIASSENMDRILLDASAASTDEGEHLLEENGFLVQTGNNTVLGFSLTGSFVPAGSGGTFIGILIGVKAIPLFADTQVVAVDSGSQRPTEQYAKHLGDVTAYVRELTDGEFPEINVSVEELNTIIDRSFSGGEYGKKTPQAIEAKNRTRGCLDHAVSSSLRWNAIFRT